MSPFIKVAQEGLKIFILTQFEKRRLPKEKPKTICDTSNSPFTKWFIDGKTNLAFNCIDRHLPNRSDQVAIKYISTEADIQKFEAVEKIFSNGISFIELLLIHTVQDLKIEKFLSNLRRTYLQNYEKTGTHIYPFKYGCIFLKKNLLWEII